MENDGSDLPYRPVAPYRPNKDTGFVPSQGYEKYRSPGFHMENEIRRAMARLRTTDRARAEEYLGISMAQPTPVVVPVTDLEPEKRASKPAKGLKPQIYGVPLDNINDTYRVVDKYSAQFSDKQRAYELDTWKKGKGKGRSIRDSNAPSAVGRLVRTGFAIARGDVSPEAGEGFKAVADTYFGKNYSKWTRNAPSESVNEGENWWTERFGRGNDPYRRNK